MSRIGLMVCLLALALDVQACWQEAGNRYHVNPALLHAIARIESGLNPAAFNRNRNGSIDIGLMQINSAWFPTLARYGISTQDVWEPCTNIHVGAWVLAQNMRKLGTNWDAVGAYNATTSGKRRAYAWKVYRNLADPNGRHP